MAVVLGLASCQTEPEGLDVQMGGAVDATITVTIPDSETRAGGNNSALGVFDNGILDGDATMRYILQVYYGENASNERLVKYSDGKEVNFDVRLVPNRDYKFVVWADVVDGEADVDKHYNTEDLKNITLKGAWDPMDESRDAFTDVELVTNYTGQSSINLELTRPFAKLRVKTIDMVEMANIGVTPAYATVEYTTPYRAAFNAFEGHAIDAGTDEKTHTKFAIANYGDNITTGDKQTKILFTDYFFAEEGDAVSFILDVYEDEAMQKLIKRNNFNTDIAVNRNYLTTIQGNILTDGNNIEVKVVDAFANAGSTDHPNYEYKTISSDKEFLAALNTAGQYIVVSDLHIAHAGDTVNTPGTFATRAGATTTTIDLNGKTITVNDNVTITIPENTTLTIKDDSKDGKGRIQIKDTDNDSTNDNSVFVNEGTVNLEGGNLAEGIINNTDKGNVTITNDNIDNNVVTGETEGKVTNYAKGLEEAFTNGGTYTLEADVTLNKSLTLAAGKILTLDLNGKTLSNSTKGNTNPQDFILVKGNLTVENGTITTKHVGDDLGTAAMTTIFDITAGGIVNLNGVTATNLGGSYMNFVAHLNNWGEATFNAENCTLEATYIAVRVFNSGPQMNNVTIKNSTLKGKYCFWVHNYNPAGDNCGYGGGTDATLNIDIYNGTNRFEYTGKAPILYGFNTPFYMDANGNRTIADGVAISLAGDYYISNAVGLKWVAENVNTMEYYVNASANIFDGKTVYLANDIDLGGDEWRPIGDYAFSRTSFNGIFDGQGYTVSNFKVTNKVAWSEKVTEASYGFFGNVKGSIKNLTIENATIAPEGGRYSAALVGRLHNGGRIDNCHVVNSSVTISHWQIGGLVGQNNNGNISGCSVVGSTITGYAAVGAIVGMDMIAGTHTIENCRVANSALVQNGSFGASYDASYGLAVGLVNVSDIVLNIKDVVAENNTIKGVADNTLVGDIENGATVTINGVSIVTTPEQLEVALKAGGHIVLVNNIALTKSIAISNANFTLDGNGKTITMAENATNDIALFDITGGKAAIKNITFDGIQKGAVVRTVGTEFVANNVTAQNCNHTVDQGLFRLFGESTIINSTFKNNICKMVVSFCFDHDTDSMGTCLYTLNIDGCEFAKNTCSTTAVCYYANGSAATLNGNKFVNNTLNVSNGATVYLGFKKNCTVTNNLFDGNTVTATSKRSAGGLMVGNAAVVTGNAFVNNTVTVNGETGYGNDVCASPYYAAIDLSGNYWGGGAPVEGDDYYKEYNNYEVIINDYLTVNPFN